MSSEAGRMEKEDGKEGSEGQLELERSRLAERLVGA